MIGLILEALLALVILLIIVWWTMFSGRPRGELPSAERLPEKEKSAAPSTPSTSSSSAHKD